MNSESHVPRSLAQCLPQSVLDAGGESCAGLRGSMYRTVATLDDGQVLEVVSRYPGSNEEIADWCRRTGHLLLSVLDRGEETLFWIRKQTGSTAVRGSSYDTPLFQLSPQR